MKNLKTNRLIKRFLKRRKSKRYIRILVKKERAEITIETAIVFTIIMILLGSMIYFSLYLHDKVAIKSYAYSGLVEGADKSEEECNEILHNKMRKAPVFVIRPSLNFNGDFNKYKCTLSENENRAMSFLDQIISSSVGRQEVEVIRKMPVDKMYLFKAIKDGIKK